jgi:hypothetical protein
MYLDEDLAFTAQEMGVEEKWVHLLNEMKQTTRQNVHGLLGEYLISYLHQNFHLGIPSSLAYLWSMLCKFFLP